MKTCSNCGKELNDNISFCPACGTALSEQSENQERKTLPYIDEILDRHLEHFPNKLGKEVETYILVSSTLVSSHIFELTIKSNSNTPLRIEITLKDSSKREKEAYERFKKKEFSSLFTTNLTWTDGYSGFIDIPEDINHAKAILSSLIVDVYQYQKQSSIGYCIKMGGNSIGRYTIKDGAHQRNKGCMSVVLALVVLGATLFCFF